MNILNLINKTFKTVGQRKKNPIMTKVIRIWNEVKKISEAAVIAKLKLFAI